MAENEGIESLIPWVVHHDNDAEGMSVCSVRIMLWLILAAATVLGGVATDFVLRTGPFSLHGSVY